MIGNYLEEDIISKEEWDLIIKNLSKEKTNVYKAKIRDKQILIVEEEGVKVCIYYDEITKRIESIKTETIEQIIKKLDSEEGNNNEVVDLLLNRFYQELHCMYLSDLIKPFYRYQVYMKLLTMDLKKHSLIVLSQLISYIGITTIEFQSYEELINYLKEEIKESWQNG